MRGPSCPWSYGSSIYNYICSQCLSPLMFWVGISIRAWCTTLCDKVCQWLATGRWFSPGPPVSSTNKTDRHDITEILLKVALNTIKQTNNYWTDTCIRHMSCFICSIFEVIDDCSCFWYCWNYSMTGCSQYCIMSPVWKKIVTVVYFVSLKTMYWTFILS